MSNSFATVTDVQNRLDYTLDAQEQQAVQYALEDMSDEARFIAGRGWLNAADAPVIVKKLVMKSVQRWAENMNGLTRSTAGDETVQFPSQGEKAGAPFFTDDEQKTIKAAGTGRIGYFFGSVFANAYEPNQMYGSGSTKGYAAPSDGGKPFPF